MKIEGSRILLVEDEPIIGFALEDMMEARGAITASAATAEAAAQLVEEQQFDGAILDVNLHGEHSYDLARTIMARGIAVIFATGYGDRAHPPDLAGVTTIPKPYTFESISDAFDRAD